MSSEWQKVRLEEVTSILGDGLHGTPEYDDQGDYHFINGNNLNNGQILVNEKTRRVSESEHQRHRKTLNDRTILVSINGTLGNVALYRGEKVVLGKSACYFNVRDNVDKQFVRYVIESDFFQSYIHNLATGSTIKNASLRLMRDFAFRLPSLEIQIRISAVLVALDDRITLLRETNATLEAIAQALFKSWFVDFDPVHANACRSRESSNPETMTNQAALDSRFRGNDGMGFNETTAALFPDSFEESELGLVPRGWGVCPVGEVVEGIYDGPHATPPESEQGPIFLGIKNLTGTALNLANVRHINEDQWLQWTRRVTPCSGDIVFSYEATLGFFALIPPDTRCCLGRRLALIRPLAKVGCAHFWFHQFISAPFQRLLDKHTIQGATVNRIALKHFPSYSMLKPPKTLRSLFENAVVPLWARIHANQAQAQTLSSLRDTLLPRLISGQLRLPEAEAMLELEEAVA